MDFLTVVQMEQMKDLTMADLKVAGKELTMAGSKVA
jgi:hypothetical protein